MRGPQRTAVAVVGAMMLIAGWLVAVEDFLVPEDDVGLGGVGVGGSHPASTIITPPLTADGDARDQGSDAAALSKKTVRELQIEVESLKAKLAAYESVDADGDAKKVVALQQALADCKRARAMEGAGRHPDEDSRALPAHDGTIGRVVETKAPRNADESGESGGTKKQTAPAPKPPVRWPAPGGSPGAVIPVVVFTYNRPDRLEATLNTFLRIMPERGFKLFVSQDGSDIPAVTSIVDRVIKKHPEHAIEHIVHTRDDSGARPIDVDQGWQAYYAIAHHYQSTVNKVFRSDGGQYQRVVLLEDDMELAHDFFELMEATAPLFDRDPLLYCVSGFNDNGRPDRVSDGTMLYRSDFFPGLGWMTSRAVWEELEAIWPKGFWDDWMRQPDKRKGRSCIRPEVPRSRALCADAGTSGGQFCEHLDRIRVSKSYVDWTKINLDYLLEPAYARNWARQLGRARTIHTVFEVETLPKTYEEAKLVYSTNDELIALEEQLELMTDFKDGVPRTAYHGTITVRFKGKRLHLVAAKELYVYN